MSKKIIDFLQLVLIWVFIVPFFIWWNLSNFEGVEKNENI